MVRLSVDVGGLSKGSGTIRGISLSGAQTAVSSVIGSIGAECGGGEALAAAAGLGMVLQLATGEVATGVEAFGGLLGGAAAAYSATESGITGTFGTAR